MFDERLNSNTFAIYVGPNDVRRVVHELVLHESPVFERICLSTFEEGMGRSIYLPEDNAVTFGHILEYLYTRDYTPMRRNCSDIIFTDTFSDRENPNLGIELANVYIMADKYQLEKLKELTVLKLRRVENIIENPVLFFKMAQKIFDHTTDSDACFGAYFVEVAPLVSKMMYPEDIEEVEDMIREGGQLAFDLFRAMCAVCKKASWEWTGTQAVPSQI